MKDARHAAPHAHKFPTKRLAELAPRTPQWHTSTTPLNPDAKTGGDALYVYANHGRWVVDCPCGGAQLTHPDDRRFLCVDCGNADNAGRYRPVEWPRQYEEIGRLLDARAAVELRNWAPPETVGDLRQENAILERGRPVLLDPAPATRALVRDPDGTSKAWRDYQAAEARYATWTPEQHAEPTPDMLADVALINTYQADAARSLAERDGTL